MNEFPLKVTLFIKSRLCIGRIMALLLFLNWAKNITSSLNMIWTILRFRRGSSFATFRVTISYLGSEKCRARSATRKTARADKRLWLIRNKWIIFGLKIINEVDGEGKGFIWSARVRKCQVLARFGISTVGLHCWLISAQTLYRN